MSCLRTSINYKDSGSGNVTLELRVPHHNYLDSLIRKNCFPELIDLFGRAHAPAKELTESYSAYRALRPWRQLDDVVVIHIGDGAHSRTGAMFAFLTKHHNISVDPICNMNVCTDWALKYKVERFNFLKLPWQDCDFRKLVCGRKCLITFVHAHVNTSEVLKVFDGINWMAAFICGCCDSGRQLDSVPGKEHTDWGILSPERRTKLVVNNGLQID